eukprot:9241368-Pyramimonas_sp.AAC.1
MPAPPRKRGRPSLLRRVLDEDTAGASSDCDADHAARGAALVPRRARKHQEKAPTLATVPKCLIAHPQRSLLPVPSFELGAFLYASVNEFQCGHCQFLQPQLIELAKGFLCAPSIYSISRTLTTAGHDLGMNSDWVSTQRRRIASSGMLVERDRQ